MAVVAAFFRLSGFAGPVSYWKSLLFVSCSTLSLTDSAEPRWLGACSRRSCGLQGPVLCALTLLALRERVKR